MFFLLYNSDNYTKINAQVKEEMLRAKQGRDEIIE